MNTPGTPNFEEKFVAFIDVLGFKGLVESVEAGDGMRKAAHYIAALERQIMVCDEADRIIDDLCSSSPRDRL